VIDTLDTLKAIDGVWMLPLPRERPDLPQLTGVIVSDGSRLLFTTAGLPNARVLALLRFDVRVPQDFVGGTLRRWV
jgi:hypothetical protein